MIPPQLSNRHHNDKIELREPNVWLEKLIATGLLIFFASLCGPMCDSRCRLR